MNDQDLRVFALKLAFEGRRESATAKEIAADAQTFLAFLNSSTSSETTTTVDSKLVVTYRHSAPGAPSKEGRAQAEADRRPLVKKMPPPARYGTSIIPPHTTSKDKRRERIHHALVSTIER